MSISPSRSQIATKFMSYVLANSSLSSVGAYSALSAIANAVAAVVSDYYRDDQTEISKAAINGVFSAFDFSSLSPTAAQAVLSLSGTPGAYIPANITVSNTGTIGAPAMVFGTQTAVYLLAASPTSPLVLSQAAGSSVFTSGEIVTFAYGYLSSTATAPTLASPAASITIAANGNDVTTSVTLPTGATSLNIYSDTASTPNLLANVNLSGVITYSGTATSGLSVVVSGSTISFTVSNIQHGGSAQPATSASGTAQVTVVATVPGAAGNVGSGSITNIVSPVNGLVVVYNPLAATGGADAETVSAQRQRFGVFINSLSRATLAALETGAETVSGVQQAVAVARAYLTVQSAQGSPSTWSSFTSEANRPKGVPFNPFPFALSVGDALYIGANRYFTELYQDNSANGANYTSTWQYYSSAGTWNNLSITLDQTSGLSDSGTVAWTLPSDWVSQTVNGTQAFWIRLSVTAVTSPVTYPEIYQILSQDVPPGFVNLYILPQSGANIPTVLQAVAVAMDSWRAAGITVNVIEAALQSQGVVANIVPTSYGQTLPLATTASTAIANYIGGLAIGSPLVLSQLYFTITSLYAGQAVSEAQITTPATDVIVPLGVIVTPGAITVNIVASIT